MGKWRGEFHAMYGLPARTFRDLVTLLWCFLVSSHSPFLYASASCRQSLYSQVCGEERTIQMGGGAYTPILSGELFQLHRPVKWSHLCWLTQLGNLSYAGWVPANHTLQWWSSGPVPTRQWEAGHTIHLGRPSHISPVFAGISNCSFPDRHAQDTHAGRAFLLLFKLHKHLKSHFIFQSVGRMPPYTRKHH